MPSWRAKPAPVSLLVNLEEGYYNIDLEEIYIVEGSDRDSFIFAGVMLVFFSLLSLVRALILILLQRGCIESNPGPPHDVISYHIRFMIGKCFIMNKQHLNMYIYDWFSRIYFINRRICAMAEEAMIIRNQQQIERMLLLRTAVLPFIRERRDNRHIVFNEIPIWNRNHTKHVARYVEKKHKIATKKKKKKNWICFNGDSFDEECEFAIRKNEEIPKSRKTNVYKKKKRKRRNGKKKNNGFDPEFFDALGNVQIQSGVFESLETFTCMIAAVRLIYSSRKWIDVLATTFLYWKAVHPSITMATMTEHVTYYFGEFMKVCFPDTELIKLEYEIRHDRITEEILIDKFSDDEFSLRDVNDGYVFGRILRNVDTADIEMSDRAAALMIEVHKESELLVTTDHIMLGAIIGLLSPTKYDKLPANSAKLLDIARESHANRLDPDSDWQQQAFKETTYDHAVKMAFKGDSINFSRSDIGMAARKLLTSMSLAPIMIAGGVVKSRREYDTWYETTIGAWDPALEFAENMASFLYQFVKVGLPYLQTGDATLLYPVNACHTWLEDADIICDDIKHPAGINERLLRDKDDIIYTVERAIKLGRMFYGTSQKEGNSQLASLIMRKIENLQDCRRRLDVLIGMNIGQCPPFAVLLWGDPDIGKSMTVKLVNATFANKLGIPSQGSLYHRNMEDKFYSGYTGQAGLIYDDLGATNPDYIAQDYLAGFLQMNGEIPVLLNMASLEDKGKVLLALKYIINTSNFIDFGIRYVFRNVAAGIRRHGFYIEQSIVAKYRKEGSTALDPDKIAGITDFSYYTFSVTHPVTTSPTHYQFIPVPGMTNVDIKTLLKFLGDKFDAHRKHGERVLDFSSKINESTICLKHGILHIVCGCPQPPKVVIDKSEVDPKDLERYNVKSTNVWERYKINKVKDTEMMNTPDNTIYPPRTENVYIPPEPPNFSKDLEFAPEIQGKVWRFITKPLRGCISCTASAIANDEHIMDLIVTNSVRAVFRPPAVDVVNDSLSDRRNVAVTFVEDIVKKYRDVILGKMGTIGVVLGSFFLGYFAIKGLISIHSANVRKDYAKDPAKYLSSMVKKDVKEDVLKDAEVQGRVIATPSLIAKRDAFDERLGFKEMVSESFPTTRPERKEIHPDNFYKPRPDNFIPKLYEILERNTYFFVWQSSNTDVKPLSSVCTFISGKICVFPKHALGDRSGVVVLFQWNGRETTAVQYALNPDMIVEEERQDFVWIMFEKALLHPSLEKFLLPMENINRVCCRATVMIPKEEGPNEIHEVPICNSTQISRWGLDYDCLLYTAEDFLPFNGMCGAVFFGEDTKAVQGIFGIHMGYDKVSLQSGINKLSLEMFERVKLKFKYPLGPNLNMVSIQNGTVIPNTKIGNLSERSVLRHLPELPIVGTNLNAIPSKHKTEMVYSIVAPDMPDIGLVAPTGMPFINDEGAFVDFMLNRLSQMNKAPHDLDPNLINVALNDLYFDLKKWVKWDDIVPNTLKIAFNGKDGTTFKRINLNASGGPGFKGKKADHVAFVDDTVEIVPQDIWYDNMRRTYRSWTEGESAMFLHVMTPKMNQAISKDKVLKGKQRTFLISSAELMIWMKLAFGAIFAAMMGKTESAIGINAASLEWQKLKEKLEGKGRSDATFKDKFVDSDYQWFDIYNFLIFEVIKLIYDLLENNIHYNKKIQFFEDLPPLSMREIIMKIGYDISVFPTSCRGDIFWSVLIIASGWFGTAEFNSLCESLIHRIVYYDCFLRTGIFKTHFSKETKYSMSVEWSRVYDTCPSFSQHVILINYGDDNVDNTSEEVLYFYYPKLRQQVANSLGFPITDARKSGDMHYVALTDIWFLKRQWLFDGFWKCPLDEKSIISMLTMYSPSVAKSREKHIVDNIMDAHRQYFMHRRSVFEEKTVFLQSLVVKYKLQMYVPTFDKWPSYDELTQHFWDKSLHMGSL